MANISGCAERRGPVPDISEFFAWLVRPRLARAKPTRLDPAFLPEDRLRDIGLRDGRGRSLRRPERPPFGLPLDRYR